MEAMNDFSEGMDEGEIIEILKERKGLDFVGGDLPSICLKH
jgi:hypothetical protein